MYSTTNISDDVVTSKKLVLLPEIQISTEFNKYNEKIIN
jgi:hypothetical protein